MSSVLGAAFLGVEHPLVHARIILPDGVRRRKVQATGIGNGAGSGGGGEGTMTATAGGEGRAES